MTFDVQVNEFHDMRISMDPRVDNPVKTSAPGRVVSFEVNITNYGNVPDTPSLHNHTSNRDGDDVLWNTVPGMGSLSSWSVEWMQVEQIGADLFTTVPCEVLQSTASAFLKTAASTSRTRTPGVCRRWTRTRPSAWLPP